ncbi:uncharacterized protein LOC129793470 [Lutzomyia longipalpis]|uniref:uncharacterized protein LOC129793470 n=1 Tax=Lutzomyia longipalpis TaxID=7200 RepID=UPI002483CEB4|nr:uncharacterized protein LOC129793470 [Lutzomyia longipalpis]
MMCDSEKNRLLRLKQVRLQSKEIAQNIRERVANEKQRQEERIKAQKIEEASRWKRRYFQEKGKQYATSLSHVGEAHAEAEKEKLLPAVPNKARVRAKPRIPEVAKKRTAVRRKSPEKMKKTSSKVVQTSPMEEEVVISSDSDSSSTLVDEFQLITSSDSTEISLPKAPRSPLIRREATIRKRPEEVLMENHPIGIQRAPEGVLTEKNCFSQVSNLLKKKSGLKEVNAFDMPSWGNRQPPLTRSPPSRDFNHFLREADQSEKPPEEARSPRRLLNGPHRDSRAEEKAKRKKIVESPRSHNKKVHYYDHPNRFHKTYIHPEDAVVKAGPSRSQNAYEDAREEVFREKFSMKMKDIEDKERSRVEKIRSAQALEKERMRRQYENLLGRIDEGFKELSTPVLQRDEHNEELVERSEEALNPEDFSSKRKEKVPNGLLQDDLDVDLLEIMGRILNKLDENKVQIIEEILSKRNPEKSDEKIEKIITQTKDIGVQSQYSPPERDTSESTVDQVEIQTVGQADKVEVVSLKDPKKKSQIQIVINVKDNTPKINNLGAMPEDAIEMANNEKRKRSISYRNLSDVIGKKYPKTPEKKGKILVDTISSIASESSASTVYHSPPSALYNDICHFMKGIQQEFPLQGAPALMERAPVLKNKAPAVKDKASSSKKGEKQSELLRKYITKLLQMPRTEVDALSVSSGTEIPTPNASVVNVPQNIAEEPQKDIPNDPLKLPKKTKKTSTKCPTLNEIPVESIAEPAERCKPQENNIPQRKEVEKERHPSKSSRASQTVPEDKELQESDLLRIKYADYTEKYMKRILKLSKLISQVRNEKNRLIAEKPLISSGSDNGLDTSTKYKDFPHRTTGESTTDMSSVSEMKSTSTGKDEQMEGNLTACKTIGLSKDSGISISRPVTSTEIRDSPEVRWIPLKRGEKAKLPAEEGAGRKTFETSKPGTLKSSSHELSTIAEMETSRIPGSSIVSNQSKVEEAFRDLKEAIERISNEIEYQRFPSFEEYVQRLAESLQDQSMGPDASGQERKLLEYFKDLSREMIFQKFPSYREFLQQEGVAAGATDTIDLEAASDNAVSEFSLPDVVAELIQRNVMDHPFRNSPTVEEMSAGKQAHAEEEAEKPSRNVSDQQTEVQPSSSSSSINLEADFRRVGLRWAANMLERTHEHQQMSSSDSSTQLNNIYPNLRVPFLNFPGNESSFVDRNIAKSPEKDSPKTAAEESQEAGKPLNLLEFLNRELEKKSVSSVSIDDSSLTNSRLKSLLDSISPKEIQRTSTPVTGSKMLRSAKNSSSLTISTESKLSSIDSVKE